MSSHYYFFLLHIKSNFTKEKRMHEHISCLIIYVYMYMYVYIKHEKIFYRVIFSFVLFII